MNRRDWKTFRREIQAVFQDPYGAFNTLRKVDRVLVVPIRKFKLASSREEEKELIIKALEAVGLSADEVLGKYPDELSGGQRQRVMLARAFLLRPRLIIADEPVSMVDASIRANILNNILDLKRKWGISFLYITHDLATAKYMSDIIIIMYRGSIVEMGYTDRVILNPLHPYAQLLIESVPEPNPNKRWEKHIKLPTIELHKQSIRVKGCKFYSRCPMRKKLCASERPRLIMVRGRLVACHLYS